MKNRHRRLVFWILLASGPLLFVWAANYYSHHPVRILLVTCAVIVAAFIIRPRIDKRR
jgi:4-hydroxybenzoate polyprenyltransferase